MIADNVARLIEEVTKAQGRAGFNEKVRIVAVTKNHTAEEAREVQAAGLSMFGENRVQELEEKYPFFANEIEWHLIGNLQKNKINHVLGKAQVIESVDSVALAEAIDARARARGLIQEVYIQLNVAREPQKHGIYAEDAKAAIDSLSSLENIKVTGIMTMAPDTEDENLISKVFTSTRNIYENLMNYTSNYANISLTNLSMGMTNDYKAAILCGSNMIRVGRALFAGGGEV